MYNWWKSRSSGSGWPVDGLWGTTCVTKDDKYEQWIDWKQFSCIFAALTDCATTEWKRIASLDYIKDLIRSSLRHCYSFSTSSSSSVYLSDNRGNGSDGSPTGDCFTGLGPVLALTYWCSPMLSVLLYCCASIEENRFPSDLLIWLHAHNCRPNPRLLLHVLTIFCYNVLF